MELIPLGGQENTLSLENKGFRDCQGRQEGASRLDLERTLSDPGPGESKGTDATVPSESLPLKPQWHQRPYEPGPILLFETLQIQCREGNVQDPIACRQNTSYFS